MRKVFITQYNPKFSYEKAEPFGEVVFLTEDDLATEPCPPGHNKKIIRGIAKKLAFYNPGHDYVLLSGSPAINVLVGILLDADVEHLILRWDNRNNEYRVSSLNFNPEEIDNEHKRAS